MRTYFTLLLIVVNCVHSLINLEEHFEKCHIHSAEFDNCVKDSINELRPYFKDGFPQYGILPFDPFHADEVPLKRSGPFFNFKLILRNVTESGWSASHITRFRSDFHRHLVQLTQFFPDKRLSGWYEFEGTFFGRQMKNQGNWELKLYDYTQTMTVTRKPVLDSRGIQIDNPPIKVKANIQTCQKLELHIGHLAGGRAFVEGALDWIINRAWQPGFVILSPFINELVSTAFTEIFNNDFEQFPFERVFPNNKY